MPRERVDETDMRILREVFIGDSESFRSDRVAIDAIAATLGLHRNTVSSRLKRLTEARVFLPASLDVEPGQFGLAAAVAMFDLPVERRTDATRDVLFALGGVQVLFFLLDAWGAVVFAEDEKTLEAKIEEIRRLTGAPNARIDLWTLRDYPPVTPVRFTPLDARLMVELLADSRAPFGDLAATLGTTAMTAQRRYERLREAGVLYMLPGAAVPIEGVVLAYVVVDIPDARQEEAAKTELQRRIPDCIVRNLAGRGHAFFIVFGRALDDLERMAHDARGVPGVAGVHLHVMSALLVNAKHAAWVAPYILRRAGVTSP